jgi:hypothetical protein
MKAGRPKSDPGHGCQTDLPAAVLVAVTCSSSRRLVTALGTPAGRDRRDGPGVGLGGRPVRGIYIPDLRLGSGIQVQTRDFR